jgi:hypothetical protein
LKARNETDKACEAILEMVTKDIVSFAEVRQVFNNCSCDTADFTFVLPILLSKVLDAGVEIGHATNITGQYVEFIGWQGSQAAKIQRALHLLSSNDKDTDFSVWLALRSNVDRYET